MGNSKKLPEKKMCIVNQVKKNMRFVTNLPDAAHAGISRRLSPAGKHLDRSADLTACSPSGGGAARCCSYFTWSRKEGAAEKQNCIPGDKPRQVYHPPPSMPPPLYRLTTKALSKGPRSRIHLARNGVSSTPSLTAETPISRMRSAHSSRPPIPQLSLLSATHPLRSARSPGQLALTS